MILLNKDVTTRRKEKTKIAIIVAVVIFVLWLFIPPSNKYAQMCFWSNHTQYFIARLKHEDVNEYIFHRNNAIFLAKMYPDDKKSAIVEMDKSIATAPHFIDENGIKNLYKDRAYINMYLRNYKEALSDFVKAPEQISFIDYLPVALLFAETGHYKHALYYCNAILNADIQAYSGYACLAHLYEKAGYPETALKVWDLALDKKKNRSRIYVSKANIYKRMGDTAGYEHEIANAKAIVHNIDVNDNYIENALNPKILTLTPQKLK